MCGIIGYVGAKDCAPILLDGLRRLEYRGYDSAGIAVVSDGAFDIRRAAGKLDSLASVLQSEPLVGQTGIGHTRWATHGPPTEVNAHPHRADNIVVVHNGIIENHLELKQEMIAQGRVFSSQTDTEIIAHLVAREREAGRALADAVRQALTYVRGAYAIAVLDQTEPGTLIAAKNASPLVIGLGEGESFLASDIPAILAHTRRIIFLEEGHFAVLTSEAVDVFDLASGAAVPTTPETISWTPAMAEKGGYKHFMLKEIHEQPRAVTDTLRGRVLIEENSITLPGITLSDEALAQYKRVVVLACGTSWHAGLIGEYLIESLARVPVEVELASEFRYRNPVLDTDCLVVAISQSGETADTIAAVRTALDAGAHVIAICNVVGSTLTRLAQSQVMTLAGPEVSVASTKAFTTQLVVLSLLALKLAAVRGSRSPEEMATLLQDFMEAPTYMEEALREPHESFLEIAQRFHQATNMLYLGRGLNYPLALEGALKLKELSYIHAEGYAAGEMKHGPIALVEESLPSVVVCPDDAHFEKTLANISEIRARSGPIVAITNHGPAAERLKDCSDVLLTVPKVPPHIQPLVLSIPLQLLSYCIADFKGTDVDQPRNLAKSVTVE